MRDEFEEGLGRLIRPRTAHLRGKPLTPFYKTVIFRHNVIELDRLTEPFMSKSTLTQRTSRGNEVPPLETLKPLFRKSDIPLYGTYG
jgi:hypothetical protein